MLDQNKVSAVLAAISDLASRIVANAGLSEAQVQAIVDAAVSSLGNAFNYVGVVSGGADSGNAFDLTTLPADGKNAGDYYKVDVGGWFTTGGAAFEVYTNSGLVWNTSGGVDVIDNTVSTVAGTAGEIIVTGSVETGFVVALAQDVKDTIASIGAPVAYSTLVPGIALTAINAVEAGHYDVYGTASQFGIAGSLVAGSTNVAGTAKVVEVSAGVKQVHLHVVVEGRSISKTIKGDVEDPQSSGNSSVIGWNDAVQDVNDLMDQLIAGFNAAGPQP